MTRRRGELVLAALAVLAIAISVAAWANAVTPDARAAGGSAPTVTVDVPESDGSSCTCLRGTVTVTATPTASAGRAITGVDFEIAPAGTTAWQLIGSAAAPPYQIDWDTSTVTPPGPYDVRAIATDSAGERTASAPARDRVLASGATFIGLAAPPAVVRGTVPLRATSEDGGNVPSTVTFQRAAAGSEHWVTIATVGPDLDDNGDPTSTFSSKLDTTKVDEGRLDLRVLARDDAGDTFVSGPRRDRLVDNTPPDATLDRPAGPLHGVVQLGAGASDAGSGVAAVRFERSAPGANLWAPIGADTTRPYSKDIDTRLLPDGTYDLRAVAVDRAGNRAPSPTVADVVVLNPGRARFDQLTIENVVAPARQIRLLGSIAGSAQHETWAFGFTNAPPAAVDGSRLPYTARGDRQLVVLRFTDAGGWQITDVLRNADGSAFDQPPQSQLDSINVTGQMTPNGEAWIGLSQRRKGQSRSEFALFHRRPGTRFLLDAAASAALAPLAATGPGLQGAELRLGETGDGAAFGVLRVPSQAPAVVSTTDANGRRTTTFQRVRYGALDGGQWTVERAALPGDYQPRPSEFIDLASVQALAPGDGWGALTRSGSGRRPLMLARYHGGTWTYVTSGLDALDLTDTFADDPALALVSPVLRADAGGVWVGGSIDPAPAAAGVVARYDDAADAVTRSWCAPGLPRTSVGCGAPLNPEQVGVPDAQFDTPDGQVALSLQHGVLDVYAHGDWSSVAAPGFAPGQGKALFTQPDEGWMVGANALGRLRATPSPPPLESWPQANRSPLTSVALPPGSTGAVDAGGALAVGLDGTSLRYDAAAGWQVEPTPSRARRVALRGVAFSGPGSAFAVGQLGTILRWDGTSWSEDPQSVSVTQSQLNAVAFGRDGTGWAVGSFGTILHFDGSGWSVEAPPSEDVGVNITSVAVAGSEVFAVAGGTLITRSSDGTWARVDPAQLPSPAPADGDLRLVSGLPDGGVAVAGRSVVMVRRDARSAFEYSTQPVEGIAVALAAFRDGGGDVRAFVSVAPPVVVDGVDTGDVAGFPPGDGELLRQTADGWKDLSRAQYAGDQATGDGAVKADPVLALATSGAGDAAWAVGGYAGTVSAARLGTDAILPARPAGWRTSTIWRYDTGGSTPSPGLSGADVSLPAKPDTVSFAYFSSPMCKSQCTSVRDAQPDVNMKAAAGQIASFAQQPGGPSFAVLGGNARGPIVDSDYAAGNGAFEFSRLGDLLAPLGALPLFAAYGPRDGVPTRDDPSQPWAEAFAQAPAPFGRGQAPDAISGAGSGPPSGPVHRFYAFDAQQNGGTLRVIVLDNADGSLEGSAPGQTAWLDSRLATARDAGLPVVVVASRPLRESIFGGASDGAAVAAKLADGGVLAVFTTSGSNFTAQVNRRSLVPESDDPATPQIPEYEGATLGYQQAQNNGVLWYSVSVDTAARAVSVKAIPVVDSLALKPLGGLSVARSSTLQFEAVGRRPVGSLATPPNDDSFPGFDSYVGIPSSSCSSCIGPSYSFKSSDPTIGTFVVPSGPGSRFPKLDASGHPTASSTSGLFCAFNTGTTTISVNSGLLSASAPVAVQAGDIGRPCGTVFRAGVGRVITVPNRSQTTRVDAPAGAAAPPPPPAAAPAATPAALPSVVPPPPPPPAVPPAPPAVKVPAVKPPPARVPMPFSEPPLAAAPLIAQINAALAQPVTAVPPVPPVSTPIPPGGAASAQAAARRKEKAVKQASQSAYSTRPAGSDGADWFYGALGGVSVLTLLLIAGGVRPGPRAQPALLLARDTTPRRRTP